MTTATRASILAALAVSATAAFGGVAAAQGLTDVRFTLDWVPQSIHGPFLIALQEGYYEDEGLNVTIDPAKGSADAVRRIIGGTHDMGFPDINALIEFNAQNPDAAITEVLMVYEQAPFSVAVLKDSGITSPAELEGKTLGAPVFDASYKLFPALAKAVGIDPEAVARTNMDPLLRETMLIQGDVDAISGHVTSILLDLKAKGVGEDKVRYFLYSDFGTDFYGNGVAASAEFLEEHPDAVKGFIRATIRGMKDMVADPERAVRAVKEFEPLVDADIERGRLELAFECCLLTENVKEFGFGGVDMERLQRAIEDVALAFDLERTPAAEEMFDPSFLPPREDRMVD